jgi:hypothetical protein
MSRKKGMSSPDQSVDNPRSLTIRARGEFGRELGALALLVLDEIGESRGEIALDDLRAKLGLDRARDVFRKFVELPGEIRIKLTD